MTLEAFMRQEAAATRRFIDKHVMDDFLHGHADYSREYRCDCGFRRSGVQLSVPPPPRRP